MQQEFILLLLKICNPCNPCIRCYPFHTIIVNSSNERLQQLIMDHRKFRLISLQDMVLRHHKEGVVSGQMLEQRIKKGIWTATLIHKESTPKDCVCHFKS